jgi:Protein of unknown function (DUF3618)
MGPEPDEVAEIRQEIDASREQLGESVAALAYKADVKNRGKEVINDKKEALMEKVDDLKSKLPSGAEGDGSGVGETIKSKLPTGEAVSEKADALKEKLPDAAPSTEDVRAKAQDAASAAGDHPLAVAAGATIAGLAAGLALPETDIERQKIGPAAQEVRQQAESKAREAVQNAKAAAQDAAGSVADAAKQAGQEQGGKAGELAEKAADKAQDSIPSQS